MSNISHVVLTILQPAVNLSRNLMYIYSLNVVHVAVSYTCTAVQYLPFYIFSLHSFAAEQYNLNINENNSYHPLGKINVMTANMMWDLGEPEF